MNLYIYGYIDTAVRHLVPARIQLAFYDRRQIKKNVHFGMTTCWIRTSEAFPKGFLFLPSSLKAFVPDNHPENSRKQWQKLEWTVS